MRDFLRVRWLGVGAILSILALIVAFVCFAPLSAIPAIPTAQSPDFIPQSPTVSPVDLTAALERARTFAGTKNSDWTPFEYMFDDGVPMLLVPVGCFMMGSDNGDTDEKPVHQQCFDVPFWIDKTEVSNAQFNRLGGTSSWLGRWTADDVPRDLITWFDARGFCAKRGARLPTEREWEYAARGVESFVYPWGNVFIADNVVYDGNAHRTAPVNSYLAGASWVGALHMSGNVWEWVSSLYQPYPYDENDENERDLTTRRTQHGGSWLTNPTDTRAANRSYDDPAIQFTITGFRCVRDVAG
jgi:formylglycine-generating enzyme required for sulfatase activity